MLKNVRQQLNSKPSKLYWDVFADFGRKMDQMGAPKSSSLYNLVHSSLFKENFALFVNERFFKMTLNMQKL